MKGRPDLVEPQDLKYVKVDPDPNFDPQHNKQVIEDTINWTEKMQRKKMQDAMEGTKERIDAVRTYVQGISEGNSSTDREKFFGKKYLAYLRGKEIMEKIKGKLMLKGRDDQIFEIVPSERSKRKVKDLIARGAI